MLRSFSAFSAIAALAALALSPPAAAATLTLDATAPTPPSSLLAPSSTTGVVYDNVVDSVASVRRSPWEGTPFAGSAYTAIAVNSSATYDFAAPQSSLEVLWGSVDGYNHLDFYSGGLLVDTVNGAALVAAGAPAAVSFILATIMPDAVFDSIVFRSSGNAFEYAITAANAVPVPGAALLLLTGLGGFAFASRRNTMPASGI